jgi:hypothetical protein
VNELQSEGAIRKIGVIEDSSISGHVHDGVYGQQSEWGSRGGGGVVEEDEVVVVVICN